MKALAALGLGLVACSALAQVPDVRFRVDAILSVRSEEGRGGVARAYDVLGRPGTIALIFYLEPGFRAYVAQRLQQIPGEPNHDPFDEYFIEDPGIWRLGKQYLPFGSGRILRESVLAARGDTNLVFEGLPISFAACDAGKNLQSGIIGRIGSRIGLSFALGRHFGIAGTALTYVRRPEDAPGAGRGYRQAFGADATQRIGKVTLRAEGVVLRNGETPADKDEALIDASATLALPRFDNVFVGATHSAQLETTVLRFGASFQLPYNMYLEPLVRFSGRNVMDAGVTLRVRF